MKLFKFALILLLLTSQICFAQWVQVGLEDKAIKDIAARNSNIFAITADSGKLYRSTDNGINWQQIVESRVIDVDLTATGDVLMIQDSIEYNYYNFLFGSSDLGDTWQYINLREQLGIDSLYEGYLIKLQISPEGIIFCGMQRYKLYLNWHTSPARSTDNGLSWTYPGWIAGGTVFDFYNNTIITVGYGKYIHNESPHTKIYLSQDAGITWYEIACCTLRSDKYCAISLFSNHDVDMGVVAGIRQTGLNGLYLSIDSCQTWMQVSTLKISTGLSLESNYMLVGTENLGVFLFYEGDSLGAFNEGLSNLNIHTVTIDESNNLYIGTDDGLWRRPLSEIIVSAEDILNTLPSSFSLSQNFPNPFNPSTTIQYSLKERTPVELLLYDILGRQVDVLVNEEQNAGSYKVNFNAENLTSGIYFYRLKAGDFVETKKMLLIK